MKIAITGKSGLGKKLAEYLEQFSHIKIVAFSSKGTSIENVEAVISKAKDCDVFINLAHLRFRQTELLHAIFNEWRHDPKKLIINISSRAAEPNISKGYLYAAQKASLNHLASNLTYNSTKRCRISTLNLGLLEDPDLDSLSHEYVIQKIHEIIDTDENIEIPELTIQHSANYKEVQSMKEALRDIEDYGEK